MHAQDEGKKKENDVTACGEKRIGRKQHKESNAREEPSEMSRKRKKACLVQLVSQSARIKDERPVQLTKTVSSP